MTQNGHEPVVPMAMPENLPSFSVGASDGEYHGDPTGHLVEAMVSSLTQWTEGALQERAFLRLYMGKQAADEFLGPIERDKPHQAFGVMRAMLAALQSISLKEFMRTISLNLGGK